MDSDESIGNLLDDADGDADPDHDDDQVKETIGEGTFLPPDTSCNNCTHQATCAFYANTVDMVQAHAQRTGVEPPIDPADLAAACDAYTPE